jgi:hypothetical protein
MTRIAIFLSVIVFVMVGSSSESNAIDVSISNGVFNVNACDFGDCVGNFNMSGANFLLSGGGLVMGPSLETPGTTQTLDFILTPGPFGSTLTFNGDQYLPVPGNTGLGSLDFRSVLTFPTVPRTPMGGFPPIAPVTISGPFTMTGHLQGVDTRTNQVAMFDLAGSGIASGQFGFNTTGGPPLEGNFIVRSAQHTFAPEPSTWLLLGSGLGALVFTRRRS